MGVSHVANSLPLPGKLRLRFVGQSDSSLQSGATADLVDVHQPTQRVQHLVEAMLPALRLARLDLYGVGRPALVLELAPYH